MKAFILAGGLGTRLRGVLPNTPKPMAPVGGRPFLEYLILQLKGFGLEEVILSVGHLSEQIEGHFKEGSKLGVSISYSRESSPLGTGGALLHARDLLEGQSFVVMNGDSFVDLDLEAMIGNHRARMAPLVTMALIPVEDVSRFGSVQIGEDSEIRGFAEKGGSTGAGLINSGVYVIEPTVLSDHFPDKEPPLSFEREVFPALIGKGFYGYEVEGFFRDIGVPEDYQAMCDDPSPLLNARRR